MLIIFIHINISLIELIHLQTYFGEVNIFYFKTIYKLKKKQIDLQLVRDLDGWVTTVAEAVIALTLGIPGKYKKC